MRDNTTKQNAKARVMIVDDDRIILESLSEFLAIEGHEVVSARSLREAVDAVGSQPVSLVLCDVNMPGGNGFELLHILRRKAPDTSIVMMTGYGTIESAVEAIKLGAFDYLTKPIVDDELKICVERALAQQAILRENRTLKARLRDECGLHNIIGQDYRMQRVYDLVESVAETTVTVLVQGPSGTGKSLIARAIHQQGDRRDKPFVEVSCGAIPETLLESELFGHVRGAFTGAVGAKEGKFKAADGGTIFLDEIGIASPALQVKLLRVLQSQEFEPVGSSTTQRVDVRVVLATNMNLEDEVRAGHFREDLYYRINVVCIEMPALSERVGDIPLLARHFLKKFAVKTGKNVSEFNEESMQLLQRYTWPGNVRELENAVERAVVLCRQRRVIVPEDLPPTIVRAEMHDQPILNFEPMPLKDALAGPEKRYIEAALQANGWNRQLTAEQLGINRTTLYKKMKHYGLEEHAARRTRA